MTRRTRYLLVLLVGVALVNLPLLHGPGSGRQVSGDTDTGTVVAVTIVADIALGVVALLLWRFGIRRRPQLRAVAMEEVQPCEPGTSFERVGGETFLVRGEVLEAHDDRVVLDLGSRSIVVLLDGHANPVGRQQSAQVHARLI